MQARLQEIMERQEIYSCEDSEFIINAKHDIKFLLELIDGQQRQLEDRLENQTNACLMCDKMDMAMLQSENEGLKEKLNIINSCFKMSEQNLQNSQKKNGELLHDLREGRDRERVLREALQEFCDRVERGEVRSRRTYSKFKQLLQEDKPCS